MTDVEQEPHPVQRVGAVTRLLPEKEAEYRRLHKSVWPGVLAALKRANISNYSIFLRDGYLFSYLEYSGDDYEADTAIMGAKKVFQDWWELTDPCQARLATGDGERWAPAEEVFHLD
ncbi:MAG TPA: L-rhamnose mutarotase [Acidimicrobiales bacterium]|nr:L-rhamnose mutarotase [Acidimicrobiales bacterium]